MNKLCNKISCLNRDGGLIPLSEDAFVLQRVKVGSSAGGSLADSSSAANSSSAGSFSSMERKQR